MRNDHAIALLCENLLVSPSGFHDWDRRRWAPGFRAREEQALAEQLTALHAASRQTYGAPRIADELRAREPAWPPPPCPPPEAPGPLRTPEGPPPRPDHRQQHDHPLAPNLLAEVPVATAPDQIRVADLTCIPTAEGWLYLAGVLNLHSHRIVGWAMNPTIDSALVLTALSMATFHRTPPPGLLCHTDRGVPYAAGNFRAALTAAGLTAAMSRRGNCHDNAARESFWSTLKLELVYRRPFDNHRAARTESFDLSEVFYHRQRRHPSHRRPFPLTVRTQKQRTKPSLSPVRFIAAGPQSRWWGERCFARSCGGAIIR